MLTAIARGSEGTGSNSRCYNFFFRFSIDKLFSVYQRCTDRSRSKTTLFLSCCCTSQTCRMSSTIGIGVQRVAQGYASRCAWLLRTVTIYNRVVCFLCANISLLLLFDLFAYLFVCCLLFCERCSK